MIFIAFSPVLFHHSLYYILNLLPFLQFFNIEKQVRLHEEFDNHLASAILDNRKNEFGCFKVQILTSIDHKYCTVWFHTSC